MFTKQYSRFSLAFALLSGLFLMSTQSSAANLVNVSSRGEAGQGAKQLVVGFVVEGSGKKEIMISAIGPTTGVPGAIANPELTVINQETGEEVYSCDNWKNCLGSNIVQVFLDETDQSLTDEEAAVSIGLGAGAYSIEIRDADGGSGIALGSAIEIPVFTESISFGTWKSEDGSICFNVVSSRLTTKFSGCPDGASLSFNLKGKTASGDECMITSFTQQQIPIENGQFHWTGTISGGFDIETISSVFVEPRLATGTATERFSNAPLSDACTAEWSAIPG